MHSAAYPLNADTRILIAGHTGLAGSALWRHFTAAGFKNVFGASTAEVDLRDASATEAFFAENQPDVVIDAAALVGGIAANARRPVEFLSTNLRIQLNLFDSAIASGVKRLLFLGSSCLYPRLAAQPITEGALFCGPVEPTNEAYAMAKLAGISHLTAIRRQYHLPYIAALPTNLYGPHDNFDLDDGHVLPAMIRRFHQAVRDGATQVVCWGSGQALREFMHADDLAEACRFLLENYDSEVPVNVGTGQELRIADLANLVADVVGYHGEIRWNTAMPDGTPRKLLDTSRLHTLGWKARIPLSDGIRSTYRWFLEHHADQLD